MKEWSFNLADIDTVAAQFWQAFDSSLVFAFHGQMGAGKTTFIHALCKAKKVSSTVGSPTFSIINEYSYPNGIIEHIDLYRLKVAAEAIGAGVEDVLYSGNICLVEWPERMPDLFPENTVNVFLEPISQQIRRLRVDHK